MKVKVALKFRGREMAHTEIGFQVVKKFLAEIAPYGHPDFQPKLVGRAINLMITPLPRNKRAKNPRAGEEEKMESEPAEKSHEHKPVHHSHAPHKPKIQVSDTPSAGGLNNPFSNLDIK
jgi:translation initiation factor IF-3